MGQQPLLTTERLILRPFQLSDAVKIQKLAGDVHVANGTVNIPHPYNDGMAGQWIGKHLAGWQSRTSAIYAITLKSNASLMGCVGLHNIEYNNFDSSKAQLGYWLGVPYWRQGYGTEAAKRLTEFGFKRLNLDLIYGQHFSRDPSPGKILQKIGMEHVKTKSGATRINMISEDLEYYEIWAMAEANS
ncbi:putative acetyltransferase [Photobacterium marinum]|uniref:Putative acetyltransferase n=1 Tax=Photobacterium marinum TaxID=1056511 RepID=L8JHC5_9GAMM|nr:GNAT family N-acetyltransferase [Photobacterium marinum]ELR66832.1 putative acetyltransferase [Photobacterium marinum]